METGTIDLETVPGAFDLQATLESGQTFLWNRLDGRTYEEPAPSGGNAWYLTVHDGEYIQVRQTTNALEWRSTTDPTEVLRERLRLDDDLDQILASLPDDPLIREAVDRFGGLRLVNEPVWGTLVSFILSAQMRVERIHAMVDALSREYGDPVEVGETTVYGFPTPERLAETSERALRDLGVGYRAPYIRETASMVAADTNPLDSRSGESYEAARERLTEFVGVGPKVADCVLLFALEYPQPVPLDTWIQTAIAEHFPEAERDSYAETSRAIRDRFGPDPGYTQTYVFHHLRTMDRDAVAADD